MSLMLGSKRYSNSRPVKRTEYWHGIPISIEIEVGDVRHGFDESGKMWSHEYSVPYGEIPTSRTLADGEGVDVYLGPNEDSEFVHVVHQLKSNGQFDEDKVILNVDSEDEALRVYYEHGPRDRMGGVESMTIGEFVNGYLASNRKIGVAVS